jgi:hypothetical protein
LIGRLGVTSKDHGGGKRRAVTSSRQRPRFRLQPFADDAGALLAGGLNDAHKLMRRRLATSDQFCALDF